MEPAEEVPVPQYTRNVGGGYAEAYTDTESDCEGASFGFCIDPALTGYGVHRSDGHGCCSRRREDELELTGDVDDEELADYWNI